LEFGSWFLPAGFAYAGGGLSSALYKYNEQADRFDTSAGKKHRWKKGTFRTPLELFIAGFRVWEGHLRRRLDDGKDAMQ
jgi:hypothetical protein